ncbi:hypothetical protein [Cryobacterium sp. MLB-32]|uniref:hypothetical protein n=1 Tax=Cryobacterium sp. MLB-32 TaxID=1529318 RepID=UPI000562CA06|nr:hypothetical protein [Cryobacterium sp. MLB-32]
MQAFIDSLSTLSKEEWHASETAMGSSYEDRYEGPNAAHHESMAAASSYGLLAEQGRAQVVTGDAVRSLGWAAEDQESLAQAAHIAVAAIVVIDMLPFKRVVPAFMPFRHTSVELPWSGPRTAKLQALIASKDYGPRTAEAQAFIASLANLTEDEYDSSVAAMFRFAAVDSEIDAAQTEILGWDWGGLSEAQEAARIVAWEAVRSLGWAPQKERFLVKNAQLAVAAIVILDHVPIEKLAPAFLPFRETSVTLPVTWGP